MRLVRELADKLLKSPKPEQGDVLRAIYRTLSFVIFGEFPMKLSERGE